MVKRTYILFLFCIPQFLIAQEKTKSVFLERKPGFFENSILRDNRQIEEQNAVKPTVKYFRADLSDFKFPNKINLYNTIKFYNPPISQGNTGTCWAFSTTSLYESEVYRLTGQKVKLSEMFTVYWEYVEKTKRYVKERGKSAFAEGSEANAVTRIFKTYGAVPEDLYNGLTGDRKFHNHETLMGEMQQYLKTIKDSNAWYEEEVVETIKSILNHYMGQPPSSFTINGKSITPKQYISDVLKLNLEDYVDILSYKQEPYWQKVEYKVTDNWWHNKDYYNVPLDVFMDVIKKAIRNGYSMSIGGDVSEAGFDRVTQAAIVPTFDIPAEYIDEDARQFRFSNESTTDDHGLHLVGYTTVDGKDWFLIKDSGSGSRNNDENGPEFGFYFFREDYIKLKMMDMAIHKDAVRDILAKFKN